MPAKTPEQHYVPQRRWNDGEERRQLLARGALILLALVLFCLLPA